MANIQANTVYHLIERGLITYESAVDGDLMLVGGSSNHRNTRVMRRHSPGFFIKQIQRWEEPSIATLAREAKCYQLGHNDADFAALTPFLPKYYDFDAGRHTLVIELLSEGESLAQNVMRTGTYPVDIMTRLGKAMASFHTAAGRTLKNAGGEALALTPPWVLTIHRQAGQNTNFNNYSRELLIFFQSSADVHAALDALQNGWRTSGFIHGDLKWDNFIITPENDGFDLKIIDWELAGFGDPCWDVGSIFQSLINFPLVTMAALTEQLPATLPGLMRYSTADTAGAIRDFWVAYVTEARLDESAAGECITRSIQYVAARMMQTAFEMTQVLNGTPDKYYADILRAKAYCLAQVSIDIFQNPASSLGALFGVHQ
jgi:Phosphotransferase enzyme family